MLNRISINHFYYYENLIYYHLYLGALITIIMSTLYIYDVTGSSTQESIDGADDVFRKMLDPNDSSQLTEIEIAKILFQNPQKNVVKIYDVVHDEDNCYIDMEYLNDSYVSMSKYKDDFKNALDQLHSQGIVYIDIKSDNIGFSSIDNTYKVFDFDCSGIVDIQNPQKWKKEPFKQSYKYKRVIEMKHKVSSLYELDDIAWKIEYQ